MVDFVAESLRWSYVAFVCLCTIGGMALLIAGVFSAVDLAISKVVNVVLIVLAIREARQQGRAPILKSWTRWSGRGQNK